MTTIKPNSFIPCPAGQHWYVEVEREKVEAAEHLKGLHSFYVPIIGWASYGEGASEMAPIVCGDYGRLVFVDDVFGKESILDVGDREKIIEDDKWQWELVDGVIVFYMGSEY